MTSKLQKYKERVFDDIKHIDEDGKEFWYARELMKVLGYSEFRKFLPVINKAMDACKLSNYNEMDHFGRVAGMVNIGSKDKRKIN